MSKDTIQITCGITVRVETKRDDDCDISGSSNKYAFRATVNNTNADRGIFGSRIVSFEMWRANKSIFGYIKIIPVLRCDKGFWSLRPGTENEFKSACAILYSLDKMMPTTFAETLQTKQTPTFYSVVAKQAANKLKLL